MANITRQLIAMDMLSQDLMEALNQAPSEVLLQVSDNYLKVLGQYLDTSKKLLVLSEQFTEIGFSKALHEAGMCHYIVNKRMLSVQVRLLEYVLDFYQNDSKAKAIRDIEFGDNADKRLDLLQTRAIVAKAQYKTVAQAMGKPDYQAFSKGVGLADFHWGWDILGF